MKVTKQHLANDATLFVLQSGSEYIEISVRDGSARMIENLKSNKSNRLNDGLDPLDPTGDSSEFDAAMDGFYALLLALATAGYDLTEMGDAITVAMDSIMNEHGES